MLPGQQVRLQDGRIGVLSRIINTVCTGPSSVQAPAFEYEVSIDGKLHWTGPVPSGGRPWWMTPEQHTAALSRAPVPLPEPTP